jgi:hypothetical protein
MGFRMREVECSSQNMAKLMMQRHTDRSQAGPRQPRTIKCIRTGRSVLWICHNERQAENKRSDRLLGHQRNDGITLLCIQGLDGVGYRVDATGDTYADRQRKR